MPEQPQTDRDRAVELSLPAQRAAHERRGGNGPRQQSELFLADHARLEQRPLYAAYNFFVENYDPANSTVVGTAIPNFLCPETPLSTDNLPSARIQQFGGATYPAGSSFAKCNYAANWGGSQNPLGSDYTTTESKTSQGAYLGVMMTVKPVTTFTTCIRAQDIRDGMANTLMVGEKRNSQGWNVGGYAGSQFDVSPTPYFVTNDPFLPMVFPGSFHASQTYFVFCDGSVHPLRSTINKAIWYALTTRYGREIISTDAY